MACFLVVYRLYVRFSVLNPCCLVRLYLGHEEAGDQILAIDHDGSSFEHTFLASLATSPSVAVAPSDTVKFLTLEIRMDLYPEEISFQLREETVVGAVAVERRASNVVFFRPPGFYNMSHANQVVREIIPLPSRSRGSLQHFTLVMIDAFGDGKAPLCLDLYVPCSNC